MSGEVSTILNIGALKVDLESITDDLTHLFVAYTTPEKGKIPAQEKIFQTKVPVNFGRTSSLAQRAFVSLDIASFSEMAPKDQHKAYIAALKRVCAESEIRLGKESDVSKTRFPS